jgi:nitrite reductase/ring-hydroxylating ferredoxin subunit
MAWYFYDACGEADVPEGSKLRCSVEGFAVAIYNVGGTLYASGDACPHERVSLGDGGAFEGETVTCGAHRWSFNVRTGECSEGRRFDLTQFPVGRKDGRIFVGFWDDDDEAE